MDKESKKLVTVLFLLLFLVIYIFANRGYLQDSVVFDLDLFEQLGLGAVGEFIRENIIDIILIILIFIILTIIFTIPEFKKKNMTTTTQKVVVYENFKENLGTNKCTLKSDERETKCKSYNIEETGQNATNVKNKCIADDCCVFQVENSGKNIKGEGTCVSGDITGPSVINNNIDFFYYKNNAAENQCRGITETCNNSTWNSIVPPP